MRRASAQECRKLLIASKKSALESWGDEGHKRTGRHLRIPPRNSPPERFRDRKQEAT